MKLCSDCKHCVNNKPFFKCIAPQNKRTNLIDDTYTPNWKFCDTHRQDGLFDSFVMKTCGKRGRWFEAKEQ